MRLNGAALNAAPLDGSGQTGLTHDASGVLAGSGSTVTGSAVYTAKHAASGVLTGSGAALSAAAQRTRVHAVVGALTGPGSAAHGTAVYNAKHTDTGALVGSGSTATGVAQRTRTHAVSGALASSSALVAASADHRTGHATSGAMHGAGSSLAGSAHRTRTHATSGTVVGTGRLLVASANRGKVHASTAVLTGAGARITSGKVNHHQGHHKHSSGSSFAGNGGLVGQGSTLHATAARSVRHQHPTLGTLAGGASAVTATATRQHLHAACGSLAPNTTATLGTSGIIARSLAKEHVVAGALQGAHSLITGAVSRAHGWDAAGAIISDESLLEAEVRRYRQHETAGGLVGPGSHIFGNNAHAKPQRRVYQRTEAQRVRMRIAPPAIHCLSRANLAHLRTEQTAVWADTPAQIEYVFSEPLMIHRRTQRSTRAPEQHLAAGALVGAVAHLSGGVIHNTEHPTAGSLTGAGSTLGGSSYRTAAYPLFSANTEIILMTYGAADGGATIGGQGTTSVTNSINGGTSAATNIFANEFVAGGLIRVRWGAGVERGLLGAYTWSGVDAQVNALKGFGKKFWILIDTQTWTNVGQSWVPDYIRADPATYGGTVGHGGEVLKASSTGAYGVIWWNANVYARWQAFINALGAKYASDPSFGGLMIGESSISYDSATIAAAGGVLFFEQNYKDMMADAAAAMGSKNLVYPNVNFLPGSNGTQTGSLNTWLHDNGYNGGTELEFPVTPLPLYPANPGSNSSANYDASGVAASLATWPSGAGQRVYAFTDGSVQWGVTSGFTTDMAERIMNYASFLGANLVSFNTVFVSGDGLPINQQWTNGYGPLVKTGYLRQ